MSKLSPSRAACAALFVLVLGSCTLAVDLDSLSDQKCPSDQKACDGRCVPKTDPKYGCAGLSCSQCYVDHATAQCGPNGQCTVSICTGSWRDCDGSDDTGCERDIDHDPNHCGRCNNQCDPVPNGTRDCAPSGCAVGACDPGFRDCNGDVDDGCEAEFAVDPDNCGECFVACGATEECVDGDCVTAM